MNDKEHGEPEGDIAKFFNALKATIDEFFAPLVGFAEKVLDVLVYWFR